jgi:hypothetical protein
MAREYECGSRNAEVGMRKSECGSRNAEVGMRNVEYSRRAGDNPGGQK